MWHKGIVGSFCRGPQGGLFPFSLCTDQGLLLGLSKLSSASSLCMENIQPPTAALEHMHNSYRPWGCLNELAAAVGFHQCPCVRGTPPVVGTGALCGTPWCHLMASLAAAWLCLCVVLSTRLNTGLVSHGPKLNTGCPAASSCVDSTAPRGAELLQAGSFGPCVCMPGCAVAWAPLLLLLVPTASQPRGSTPYLGSLRVLC